jgi:phosphoserine phosphatase
VSAYASVVLDMDSTLASVEGIDWLAKRRGPAVARDVAALTERAMNGELALDAVYGERLALIRPSTEDVAALARLYEEGVAPGAPSAIEQLRDAGVALTIVSGGILDAILPCARGLGFADGEVHAVRLSFDERGEYRGYDRSSPLATQLGKRDVLRALRLPRPLLAVGDGSTDAAMAPEADTFAAFTGFVRREPVVAVADSELRSFDDLLELVL